MTALNRTRSALCLVALLALAWSTVAQDWQLVGLGQHQETGRDIYIGGIYLQAGTPRPDDFSALPGPWKMEFRITARRTSIRSLLGGMLLQSEVATGRAPGPATTEFADDILSAIKSSLYAGDTFNIELEDGVTYALLNEQVVARSADPGVASYFLMGWISERGPASSFRDALLAPAVDEQLLALHGATNYTEERRAEVAGWFGATAPTPATAEPGAATPDAGAAESTAADSTAAEATAIGTPPFSVEPPVEAAAGEPADEIASLLDEPAAARFPGLEAIATDIPPLTTATADAPLGSTAESAAASAADAVMALDVQQYSQRLAAFQSRMVSQVYSKIRYPKRAVRRNLQGRLELDVVVSDSGELRSVEVASSSGYAMLDDAAVEAAEDAFRRGVGDVDPVARAEFGVGPDKIIVPVPVQFRLQ